MFVILLGLLSEYVATNRLRTLGMIVCYSFGVLKQIVVQGRGCNLQGPCLRRTLVMDWQTKGWTIWDLRPSALPFDISGLGFRV